MIILSNGSTKIHAQALIADLRSCWYESSVLLCQLYTSITRGAYTCSGLPNTSRLVLIVLSLTTAAVAAEFMILA